MKTEIGGEKRDREIRIGQKEGIVCQVSEVCRKKAHIMFFLLFWGFG